MKMSKMLAPKRYIPDAKNFSTFPFFNMKVVDMKAWQLYLGQSTFVVVMGLIFYAIIEFLKILGLAEQPILKAGVDGLQSLATGQVDTTSGKGLLSTVMGKSA